MKSFIKQPEHHSFTNPYRAQRIESSLNYTLGLSAAFTTVACWTVGTLSFTKASKIAEPLSVNRVRLLYATILLSLTLIFIFQISPLQLFRSVTPMHWFWLGISGIIGLTIGDFFWFTAFRLIGGSKTSLFNPIAPIAAFMLGIFILDENMNWIGIMGMSISIGGILWFIRSNQHDTLNPVKKEHAAKGMLFAALGAICQGLGLVCAKKGLILAGQYDIPPMHATWVRMSIATLTTYSIGVFRSDLVKEFKHITFSKAVLKPVLLGTFFGPVIGVTMSMVAAKNMEVSFAQTILSLLPISVMLTAFISGKEKVQFISFIAALISISGVIVLAWKNEILAFLLL